MTRIRTLLVANRGEIAARVIRTARALGMTTVAVYSDPDRDAPFVRAAHLAVPLGGLSSAESYLDADRILVAARRSGADAIHPGYGFLSENPAFAEAVADAGLVWVGPTPQSIRAMALKVESKRTAADAGVPLVPGAELADDLPHADLAAIGAGVGYPLLVKASAGGGGKGMRIVHEPAGLPEAVAAARREAVSAFGDGTVFLERYLLGARHVEVQVFGDEHGNVVHLFERECSIQRRHQKVVEEAPSPGVTADTAARMHAAAVSLARAIGYVGAGTVEFLVFGEGEDQRFSFLEMNTRLQVEHPVTEETTGLDLVEWQLRVAQGQPLPLSQEQISRSGHAIEVRLYAEDPVRGYLPNTGVLGCFEVAGAGVRVDSGVTTGSVVTAHYDPMLAKVIARGDDRDEAALRLSAALRAARLHGLTTNRDSLVAVLESPDFLAGRTTTAFLEEHPEVLAPSPPADRVALHLVAAAAAQAFLAAPGDGAVPPGWRNVPAVPESRHYRLDSAGEAHDIVVSYRRRRDDSLDVDLSFDGAAPDAAPGGGIDRALQRLERVLATAEPGEAPGEVTVRLEHGLHVAARVTVRPASAGDDGTGAARVWVDDGTWSTSLAALPRFRDASHDAADHGPSTPVPGTVTLVLVAPGDEVVAGQALVVLEAMKMEHRISADADGVVAEVLVSPGQSVDAHQVVVVLEEVPA